jgi:kynurenine formamidase
MRFRTLAIGYGLALALFLFAQQRPQAVSAAGFHGVLDLTQAIDLGSTPHSASAASPAAYRPVRALIAPADGQERASAASTRSASRIVAPAELAPEMWAVDQIPAERLIAPLVVLDLSSRTSFSGGYRISVEDISRWEHANGQIPLGAVVMARTGSEPASTAENLAADRKTVASIGYSEDAAKFLVEGREVLGLGTDTPRLTDDSAEGKRVFAYTLAHSVYHLENVANLDRAPDVGAVLVVAPLKVSGRSSAAVRLIALLR